MSLSLRSPKEPLERVGERSRVEEREEERRMEVGEIAKFATA